MQLSFRVKGSAPEPYEVTFTRSGNNLTTTCTCPAGKNGQYCKHRFGLMEGDLSALVSTNTGDIPKLHELILGTDVADAYRPVHEANNAVKKIGEVLKFTPPVEAKPISEEIATEAMRSNGILKGNESSRQFHLFLLDGTYKGSLKAEKDVFKADLTILLPGLPLESTKRKDDQVKKGSKALYCYLEKSEFHRLLLMEEDLPKLKLKLRRTMRD
jgi:hypothetical protein